MSSEPGQLVMTAHRPEGAEPCFTIDQADLQIWIQDGLLREFLAGGREADNPRAVLKLAAGISQDPPCFSDAVWTLKAQNCTVTYRIIGELRLALDQKVWVADMMEMVREVV